MSSLSPLLSLSLIFSILSTIAIASVPPSARFQYVIDSSNFQYPNDIIEYDATYVTLPVSTGFFRLCFYNTTPNAFTFALQIGNAPYAYMRYWVWEANRGNPIGENATLTFREDGNLVLAEADGRIAWQTNTANKGVVGIRLTPVGNLVLHDAKANVIWQSFDYPTDTLLVGQYLRVEGPARLVSRVSRKVNSDGPHSLVLEPTKLALYYKSANSQNPYVYYVFDTDATSTGPLHRVKLYSNPMAIGGPSVAYSSLYLNFFNNRTLNLAKPRYKSVFSFLRLGIDGNLRLYTMDYTVDEGVWEETFTLFSEQPTYYFPGTVTECQLPEKCGKFGLCEDGQCVACPLPNGLVGWSKDCEPVKPPSCGSKNFHYYKLVGVDHYMSKYTAGSGPMKEEYCVKQCSGDCKCLGYFYNKNTSRCWIAFDLHTLTRVTNSSHVGYIKVPNST